MSALEKLGSIGGELVRVVLGSPCVACGRELPVRRRVASCCVDCWSVLPRLPGRRCRSCAIPLPAANGDGDECLRCVTEPLATAWIDSWGRYDSGLTKVLHAFKFEGQAFLADPLADLLASAYHARERSDFDVLVPVPMSPARERKRGYNQAALLARSLAGRLRVAFDEHLIRKTVERRTQSELKKAERRGNVRGTFDAERCASGCRVLLVDDICTTGETLSACADVLRGRGAAEVAAITVARTP
jgi:ComF family protein